MRPRLVQAALAATIVAAMLSACGSPVPGDGAGLAKAGQTAATRMQQAATLSAATYAALNRAVVFDAGFGNDMDDPATQEFMKQEAGIQTTLSAYAAMLDALAAAYATLGNLAAFNAEGNFGPAADSLCASAARLVDSMARTPTRANPCQRASAGAGMIIGSLQAQHVLDASNRIEIVLRTVIPILADPARRNLIVMNNGLVQRQIVGVATDLFSAGVYSCAPLLDALGAPLNLKSVSAVDALVARNPNLRRGCLNAVSVSARDAVSTAGAAYDKTVDALNALLKQHENLKAGVPLDFAAIGMILSNLQGLASRLQAPKGT